MSGRLGVRDMMCARTMAVLVDQEISGQGLVSWGDILKIDHVALSITTLGVHNEPEPLSPDRLLRCGWFSLGVNLDQGVGAVDLWTDPHFVGWLNTIWAPPSDIFAFFERVRWSLTANTVGWLRVESA